MNDKRNYIQGNLLELETNQGLNHVSRHHGKLPRKLVESPKTIHHFILFRRLFNS